MKSPRSFARVMVPEGRRDVGDREVEVFISQRQMRQSDEKRNVTALVTRRASWAVSLTGQAIEKGRRRLRSRRDPGPRRWHADGATRITQDPARHSHVHPPPRLSGSTTGSGTQAETSKRKRSAMAGLQSRQQV